MKCLLKVAIKKYQFKALLISQVPIKKVPIKKVKVSGNTQ